MNPTIVAIVVVLIFIFNAVKTFQEYERAIIFTFGRLTGVKGPGIRFIIPFVQRAVKIDTRTITMDVPSQDVITKDNVSVKVNAVLYYRVVDPAKAIVQVEDYHYATSQIAQTTLRSVCGQAVLDDILAKRDEISHKIQTIIDHQTDPWGIKVGVVEIKHIDLPQEMQRTMAQAAEADRERTAKIIRADGELQAATTLSQAAGILAAQPISVQLRYLETLRDIASEHNSTIVFPLPINFFESFMNKK